MQAFTSIISRCRNDQPALASAFANSFGQHRVGHSAGRKLASADIDHLRRHWSQPESHAPNRSVNRATGTPRRVSKDWNNQASAKWCNPLQWAFMLAKDDARRVSSVLFGRTLGQTRSHKIELGDGGPREAWMARVDRPIKDRDRDRRVAPSLIPKLGKSRQCDLCGRTCGESHRVGRRCGHDDERDGNE